MTIDTRTVLVGAAVGAVVLWWLMSRPTPTRRTADPGPDQHANNQRGGPTQ